MNTPKLIAIFLAIFAIAANAATYVITGSDAEFTAVKDETTVIAAQPIKTVIDAIKTDAAGEDCTIQFGDGDVLDLGTETLNGTDFIEFDGGESGTDWGLITLEGKITSANNFLPHSNDIVTIYISNGASIASMADIYNTTDVGSAGRYGYAIYNASIGSVNINGGTVSAAGTAIRNDSTGAINISGGTVSNASSGGAISNRTAGTVNISGGIVSAASNDAIVSNGGKITVSGNALVTSGGDATIHIGGNSLEPAELLEITGGTIENTKDIEAFGRGYAILNASAAGTIKISGGTFSTIRDHAVYNGPQFANSPLTAGNVIISGGIFSANNGSAVDNQSTGTVSISDGTFSSTGAAIINGSTGTVNISGGTFSITDDDNYTIRNWSSGTINISGGTIWGPPAGWSAIENHSTDGILAITGGLVFFVGTYSGFQAAIRGNYTTPSGNPVIIAWDKRAGNTEYVAGTSTDISALPSGASAVWLDNDGKAGISYANGANTGFIPIDTLAVKKFAGIFGDSVVVSAILSPGSSTLKLGDVPLPPGYAWVNPSGSVETYNYGRCFNATFTDPSGDYTTASGCIYVNVEEDTPIRLPQAATGNIRAQAISNSIVLENLPPNAKIEVYSLQGKRIYSTTSHSPPATSLTIPVQTKGMYIIKAKFGSETKLLRVPLS